MSIWLDKNNKCTDEESIDVATVEDIAINDDIFSYSENDENGSFFLKCKYTVDEHGLAVKDTTFEPIDVDLPYTTYYKTKNGETFIKLSDREVKFILGIDNADKSTDIRELFTDYINNDWDIETKKVEKRIKYLDKILPEKLDSENPISIFDISDKNKLEDIAKTLKKGNSNYEWDRTKGGGGEVQQTLNQYIKFLEKLSSVDLDEHVEELKNGSTVVDLDTNSFQSFIEQVKPKEGVQIDNKWKNIEFVIGQPNTGKSFNFEESELLNTEDRENYKYKKIPVSGGIGNEYKGLQNTDLAITYDPIKKELRFGEFLQMLMSAIVNPKVPHVVFLDDFHNQDISSLLSEYTPLFKGQQKRIIDDIDLTSPIYNSEFQNTDDFIKQWNDFLSTHCKDLPTVPLTNRISGNSLNLVYPANFYLLGAANFNENSLNIFADWEDRASIRYVDPIESFNKAFVPKAAERKENMDFLGCCKSLNTSLHEVLKGENIYDYDRYCFGMWKIVDAEGNIVSDVPEQIKLIDFFFGMIKNSLKFNNKNSEINTIGWKLMQKMQDNEWFKKHIQTINRTEDIDYEILHEHNIYEDEI